MGKIIEFPWHKIGMIAIMLYFSLCFTTICLPLMWWYYKIPTSNYYFFSLCTLFFGGLIFNIILAKIYPIKAEELQKGFPKSFVIIVFLGKFILYLLFCSTIYVLTNNVVLCIYLLMFLMSGGYFWYCILRGYILARNNYKGPEINNSITSQGKVIVFSIPASLVIGYIILL
ncbi:hypothetical protein Pryu01_02048 [Paraliobacillus ryukyuensis]|uniref:Uncharacterized protein n=1 Tax=Paraliobacillus ryukyuensis TaxID=200904 RepID=A0A366E611_9BACI|nr:hypothetical protein [Paraliobacillus ryukyuensis]RBO97219.1 hypothetical protein DES48_107138 [Paraliobacillus ryukyuensis]